MSRSQKNAKIHVGGMFPVELVVAFNNLVESKGTSATEGLRRLMTQAILNDEIPGISNVNLEQRERERWGEVAPTPTYSGEDAPEKPTRKPGASQVSPARLSESTET